MKILPVSIKSEDLYNKNYFNFKYSPWKLNLGKLEYANQISGQDAIRIFENFRLGNYLDIDGGVQSYTNSMIRRNNLSFLDKLKYYADKKEFVDYYKNLTGFPNLWNVAEKIKNEFKSAVTKAEAAIQSHKNFFDKQCCKIQDYGYDGVSSVAKKKALPGSDLDKAFVVIKGHSSQSEAELKKDEEIIEEFKAELWKNTDQRILSYNHDADSFPKVYSEQQIINLIKKIDGQGEISRLEKAIPPLLVTRIFLSILFEKKHPSTKYSSDYIATNSLFIKICKKFPKRGSWKLDSLNPSRENIYNFGFVLEALKWGEHFTNNYNYWVDNSKSARNINVSQIYSLKHSEGYKDKYAKREQLASEFNNWSVDKQLQIIKDMILNSCGEKSYDFPEYFASSEINKFESLMKAVGL